MNGCSCEPVSNGVQSLPEYQSPEAKDVYKIMRMESVFVLLEQGLQVDYTWYCGEIFGGSFRQVPVDYNRDSGESQVWIRYRGAKFYLNFSDGCMA